MMEKRGQSGVITIVLIILITMVAIIIFWNVVRGVIKEKSEEIDLGVLTVNLEIDKQSSVLGDSSTIVVERNAGKGNITALKFVFKNMSGDTYVHEEPTSIGELETAVFDNIDVLLHISGVSYVEIYPIFKTASGKEKIGMMQDSMGESEAGGTPGVCSGIDTSCGTYPNCINCNLQDGCDATDYKDYSCVNNVCSPNTITQLESLANNNCNDLKDNDCDTKIDSADSGCTCPDGTCSPGENCIQDNSVCPAPAVCYNQGTCTNGCVYTPITSGQTDAGDCDASNAYGSCTSPPCQCNGAGTCIPAGIPISSCGFTIITPGIYYLTQDLSATSGDCIKITGTGDDVSINGNGKRIIVNTGATRGIYIYGASSTDIVYRTNLNGIAFEIKSGLKGIEASYADNFNISGSTFTFLSPSVAGTYGILVSRSTGIIENNVFSASAGEPRGIYLSINANNNKIINNSMDNLYYGVYIHPGSSGSIAGNWIEKNTISNSRYYGVWINSNGVTGTSFTNNKICGIGTADIYDWFCGAWYDELTNICKTHSGCLPVPCSPCPT